MSQGNDRHATGAIGRDPDRLSAAERTLIAREKAVTARENALERMTAARDRASMARGNAVDRATSARDNAVDRAGLARDAAVERATAMAEGAADTIKGVKPRFRGVSHEWSFFLALGLGISLLMLADTPRTFVAMAIYSASLCALFGTSALYHRVNWKTLRARMIMRRLDHSMIFLLIAGTVTPFALLTMDGSWGTAILIAVWSAALIGVTIEMLWFSAPKWVSAVIYISVGWVGALAFPQILSNAGIVAGLLIATGGVLYTLGAVVYASQRPDPNPAVFGYHEVFHLLTIAAAGAHFAAIAFFVL